MRKWFIIAAVLLGILCCNATERAYVSAIDPDKDDTLTLQVSEPVVEETEKFNRWIWYFKVCDNHWACDDEYLKGDLDQDRKVDYEDLAIFAENWLESDYPDWW